MTVEHESSPNQHPIVNPYPFLERPFTRLEIGRLAAPPTIKLLHWLTTLKGETGLVLQTPTWYVIKASGIGVPFWVMPEDSDILIHSHTGEDEKNQNDNSIPSIGDYFKCSAIAKNFIVSYKGITQYWPVSPENKRHLGIEIQRDRFGEGKQVEYLRFLEAIEAKFNVFTWDGLNEEKLSQLFTVHPIVRSDPGSLGGYDSVIPGTI